MSIIFYWLTPRCGTQLSQLSVSWVVSCPDPVQRGLGTRLLHISINDSTLASICYTVIYMVKVGLGLVSIQYSIWMLTYCHQQLVCFMGIRLFRGYVELWSHPSNRLAPPYLIFGSYYNYTGLHPHAQHLFQHLVSKFVH